MQDHGGSEAKFETDQEQNSGRYQKGEFTIKPTKPDLIIPTEEPDDLMQLMNRKNQPPVPKNNVQSNMYGSPFSKHGQSQGAKSYDLSRDVSPPIK